MSIQRVIAAGIMGGHNTGFAPNEPLTRAEVAVVLGPAIEDFREIAYPFSAQSLIISVWDIAKS
ncbi:S-layer homology domain-containing protein [Paenibacillus thiaminolyticus]|uniref:S-layer homology domain-containing protein n=1 Tax=Paenibacillus thiaminolyticus TaxID=49283 RepID=UPI002175D33A|nr:S-layer homology domain-containing protein [Paenibacillus thiaminolyticus]